MGVVKLVLKTFKLFIQLLDLDILVTDHVYGRRLLDHGTDDDLRNLRVGRGQGGVRRGQSGVGRGQGGVRRGQGGVRRGQSGVRRGQGGVRRGQSGVRHGQSGVRSFSLVVG